MGNPRHLSGGPRTHPTPTIGRESPPIDGDAPRPSLPFLLSRFGWVSLLFGFAMLLAIHLVYEGGVFGGPDEFHLTAFAALDILWYLGCSLAAFALLCLVYRFRDALARVLFDPEPRSARPFALWGATFAILLAAWLPYLLSFAPGSVLGDSFRSIMTIYVGSPFDNIDPVAYTMLLGGFLHLGEALGSPNAGVLAYAILQSCVLSAFLATCTKVLRAHGVRLIWVCVAVAFYAVFPVFPSYAIILWKDPLFSVALGALSLLMLDVLSDARLLERPDWLVLTGLAALAALFLRNNGVFVVAALVPLVLIGFGRRAVRVVGVLVVALGIALVVQGPVYDAMGVIERGEEALGVPIQQVAATIVEDEEALAPEQLAFLDRILPIETWKESYRPGIVDPIKWHTDFDAVYLREHAGEFLRLWLDLLPSHLGTYASAYALLTTGFWHPWLQDDYGYIDQYILENEEAREFTGIHPVDLFEQWFGVSIADDLRSFRPTLGSGTLLWALLASLSLAVAIRGRAVLPFYGPGLLCALTIFLATPVAFSLRYVFVLALLLPLYVAMPFLRSDAAESPRPRPSPSHARAPRSARPPSAHEGERGSGGSRTAS